MDLPGSRTAQRRKEHAHYYYIITQKSDLLIYKVRYTVTTVTTVTTDTTVTTVTI